MKIRYITLHYITHRWQVNNYIKLRLAAFWGSILSNMHIQTKHHFCWRLMYSKWVQQFPMFAGSAMFTPRSDPSNNVNSHLPKWADHHPLKTLSIPHEKYKFVSNLQYSHKKNTPKEGVNFPPKSSKNCLKQQVCYPCSKYFEYSINIWIVIFVF